MLRIQGQAPEHEFLKLVADIFVETQLRRMLHEKSLAARPFPRCFTHGQFVKQHANREYVVRRIRGSRHEAFGGRVCFVQDAVRSEIVSYGIVQYAADTEVAEHRVTFVMKKDILGCNILMNEAVLVKKGGARCYVRKMPYNLLLGERLCIPVRFDGRAHRAALHERQKQIGRPSRNREADRHQKILMPESHGQEFICQQLNNYRIQLLVRLKYLQRIDGRRFPSVLGSPYLSAQSSRQLPGESISVCKQSAGFYFKHDIPLQNWLALKPVITYPL